MDSSKITFNALENIHRRLYYKWRDGFYDLNVGAVRTLDQTPNAFNDWLYVAYRNEYNAGVVKLIQGTTEPGVYWLKKPMNVLGTFILCPGQYEDSHTDGLHNGRRALIQCGMLRGWRDNNKDGVITCYGDLFSGKEFQVDIHEMGLVLAEIDKWSAGCQGGRRSDIEAFMRLYDKMVEYTKRTKIDYTLLEETDFG
jgi:hypothetical protein